MVNIWILKKKQKAFYKSIISVFCPILNDTVYFTSDGFAHLLYKDNRNPRNVAEQFMKLQCLTYAPDIIKNCILISETRKLQRKVKGKIKDVVHYELVYEIKRGRKVRVVIEKVGTGKHKFLSTMRDGKWPKPKKRP